MAHAYNLRIGERREDGQVFKVSFIYIVQKSRGYIVSQNTNRQKVFKSYDKIHYYYYLTAKHIVRLKYSWKCHSVLSSVAACYPRNDRFIFFTCILKRERRKRGRGGEEESIWSGFRFCLENMISKADTDADTDPLPPQQRAKQLPAKEVLRTCIFFLCCLVGFCLFGWICFSRQGFSL